MDSLCRPALMIECLTRCAWCIFSRALQFQFESPDTSFLGYKPPPYVLANNTPGRCGMIVLECKRSVQLVVEKIQADACGWIWVSDPQTN
eukprot:COSAG01_NODE_58744_length_304_cov_0.756098_1_plen_89_part_01